MYRARSRDLLNVLAEFADLGWCFIYLFYGDWVKVPIYFGAIFFHLIEKKCAHIARKRRVPTAFEKCGECFRVRDGKQRYAVLEARRPARSSYHDRAAVRKRRDCDAGRHEPRIVGLEE